MDSPTSLRRHKRHSPRQMQYRKSLLIEKYGMKCFWCEVALTKETLTIDHFIPLSKGGNNKLRNLRTACKGCNNKRGDAMPEDTPEIIAEKSCIRFPSHWPQPKYQLGQLVKQGRIIGIEYQSPGTRRAYDLGKGWIYAVLIDDLGYDTLHLKDSEIEPPPLSVLQAEINYEKSLVEIHQKNLVVLDEQLSEVAQVSSKQESE
ncbi:HNH endonuclease [Nostoc sp. TCL240-02]|uniref:HNH endonuclease n=1 Tax=Nostoc sp. TCL240-02 TaxID=2572090 RepID=UPI00157F9F09|nr:HNH endonuclease [Nostoc sp. TCL240-02]QKQ75607.1 HNH endonuclease [Nostoc sp. TCL240-02]